jgi:hypothetical protein
MPLTKIKSLGITDGTITSADLATGVGGKALQVISAVDSTQRSTLSSTFVTASNTLSVSITPSSSSNKILILVSTPCIWLWNQQVWLTVYRGATNLGNVDYGFSGGGVADFYRGTFTHSVNYLDSPSSTSALTYQVYIRTTDTSYEHYINRGGSKGSITCIEIAG